MKLQDLIVQQGISVMRAHFKEGITYGAHVYLRAHDKTQPRDDDSCLANEMWLVAHGLVVMVSDTDGFIVPGAQVSSVRYAVDSKPVDKKDAPKTQPPRLPGAVS